MLGFRISESNTWRYKGCRPKAGTAEVDGSKFRKDRQRSSSRRSGLQNHTKPNVVLLVKNLLTVTLHDLVQMGPFVCISLLDHER